MFQSNLQRTTVHKLNQKLLRTRRGFEALAKYLVSRVCFARLLVISCKSCGGSHKLLAPDVSVTQRQEGESCRRECSYAASLGPTQLWLVADSGVVPLLLLLRDFSCLQVQIPKPKPPPGTRVAVLPSDLSDRCFLLSHRHCVDAFRDHCLVLQRLRFFSRAAWRFHVQVSFEGYSFRVRFIFSPQFFFLFRSSCVTALLH